MGAVPIESNPAKITNDLPTRGSNATALKAYNERVMLSLIRAYGSLSKAEIARITGLSSKTCSVIMKELERGGLILRREPQRGKVGQPLVPFSLSPDGALSIGFKFGRRSADLVLVDFLGSVRHVVRSTYAYPEPRQLETFVRSGVEDVTRSLSAAQRTRICGLGIAAPFEMWSWEAEVGAPAHVLEAWRSYDIAREVRLMVPWPVHFCKDATAACAAELSFGSHSQHPDFFYVFIATLIGGGVVLNGSLYPGRTGYAGSFGSVLVPDPSGKGTAQRLIRCASIYLLEDMLRESGRDVSVLNNADDWSEIGSVLDQWIEQVSESLSMAIGSAIAILDFQAIVIDGEFPPAVRARIVQRTKEKMTGVEQEGVAPVEIVEGVVGRDARVRGAALLPLIAGFERDRNLLLVNER
jgi:predicted NBD/HSP70 family sugar kinase